MKRKGFTPASKEQKAKVEREGARVPYSHEWTGPIDAAHVVPRSLGGCDHPDCVVGLERAVHRAYDEGHVDLLPYLTLEEQAHAASHLGLLGALRRTTGDRYVPARDEAA